MRAWFSIWIAPERRVELLHQVVLFVVQRRAAQAGDAQGAVQVSALLVGVLPGAGPGVQHPIDDHVDRGVQVQVLPLGTVRAPVPNRGHPAGRGDQRQRRGALGAQPAAADGGVRIALDVGHPAAGAEHPLSAADRAERADRRRDRVGDLGAGPPRLGTGRAGRTAATQAVRTAQLPDQRPLPDPVADVHSGRVPRIPAGQPCSNRGCAPAEAPGVGALFDRGPFGCADGRRVPERRGQLRRRLRPGGDLARGLALDPPPAQPGRPHPGPVQRGGRRPAGPRGFRGCTGGPAG